MPETRLSTHTENAESADRPTDDKEVCAAIESAVATFLTEQIVEQLCEEVLNQTCKGAVDSALLRAAYRQDTKRRHRIRFTGREPPRALRGWEWVREEDSEVSGED